jgi:hypothetical protein
MYAMLLDSGKDAIRVAAGDAVNGLLVILSQRGETRAWPGRRMAYSVARSRRQAKSALTVAKPARNALLGCGMAV